MARDRVKLFTNLDFVKIGAVYAHCHALVLMASANLIDQKPPRYMLVGYLYDASMTTFEADVPGWEYELISVRDMHAMLSGEDLGPLTTGAIMRFVGAEQSPIQLIAHDVQRPIHIEDIEAEKCISTSVLSSKIVQRIREHSQSPYMPVVTWISKS
jgi:hypothetical protein